MSAANSQVDRSQNSSGTVQDGFRQVMRVFPQGVTVVTTMAPDGPRGLTVSAFTSISLDPPLVLISISKASHTHPFFMKSEGFAVNLLADDQKSVSESFAGRTASTERFRGIEYTKGITGAPIIKGVRAIVECRMWRAYDGGDHTILIGEVVRAQKLNDKPPLVFYAQQYTTTERREVPPPSGETMW